MQQIENASIIVNQLLAQIQDLQDKVNSLNDERDTCDLETARSSGISHVPSQPLSIPSCGGMISRGSCVPHDTRNSICTSGNVFESLPSRDGPSSASFEKPKSFASSSCGLRPGNTGNILEHGEGVRREPQSSTIPTPRFTRKHETWALLHRTGGTHSQYCMMETPKCSISELHIGKFPDSVGFQCWKVSSKTEVCANTPCPMLTMSWIREVEMATSIDDLMTSQSIKGKISLIFEMLDAKIASALRKIISNSNFRRRFSVED